MSLDLKRFMERAAKTTGRIVQALPEQEQAALTARDPTQAAATPSTPDGTATALYEARNALVTTERVRRRQERLLAQLDEEVARKRAELEALEQSLSSCSVGKKHAAAELPPGVDLAPATELRLISDGRKTLGDTDRPVFVCDAATFDRAKDLSGWFGVNMSQACRIGVNLLHAAGARVRTAEDAVRLCVEAQTLLMAQRQARMKSVRHRSRMEALPIDLFPGTTIQLAIGDTDTE